MNKIIHKHFFQNVPPKVLLFVSLFCFLNLQIISRDIVLIDKSDTRPVQEKEAILILPGFGTLYHNTKNQILNFKNQGFDVFIPDYISRKSIDQCAENVNDFILSHKLSSYKKVHIFAYIIGSWTINRWSEKYSLPNVSSILYDRSPMQEKAPAVLVIDHPFLSKILFGKLIAELAVTDYPPLKNDSKNIGLLIEGKATKLMWKKRKSLNKVSPVSWEVKDLRQDYDDLLFLYVDHDDLYIKLENIAPEVLNFFRSGKFSSDSIKKWPQKDPFEPYNKK